LSNHLLRQTRHLLPADRIHLPSFARSRWTLLKTILSEKVFQRVLLITTASDLKGIASLLKAVARTEWNISDLKDWSGQSLISEPKFVTVEYKRGDDEVSLFQSLISLIQQLNPTSAAQSLKAILLKQAASSPLTLERSVRQLRNNLAHSKSEIFVASEIRRAMEDGTEEPAADSILPSMSTGRGIGRMA
jgi:hypothetical protein